LIVRVRRSLLLWEGRDAEEKSEWAGVDYGLGEEGVGGSDAEGKKKVKSRRR